LIVKFKEMKSFDFHLCASEKDGTRCMTLWSPLLSTKWTKFRVFYSCLRTYI